MPALITCATAPLPMETVPAIKITHYNGAPKSDEAYAYARLYALKGTLKFSLTRFEETPADTVRMGIALSGADSCNEFLFLSVSFTGESMLCLYNNGVITQNYTSSPLQISHGGDEQGLYYTAEGEIPSDIIEKAAGKLLLPNEVFAGNIYSYDISESAFGSAFKVPLQISIPSQEGFEAITCVSY